MVVDFMARPRQRRNIYANENVANKMKKGHLINFFFLE